MPSSPTQSIIADFLALYEGIKLLLLISAAIFAGSFVYIWLGLVYYRIKTGQWTSHESERFLGVDPAYSVLPPLEEVAVQVQQPLQAKPRKKKKKKKPLPKEGPPRPTSGPRVQSLTGRLSYVPGRVHLDQCASSYERKELLAAHGLEVTMTHEVGLLHASDRKQLNYAIRNRAVIVTYDHDFLGFHDAGETHAGIIHSPQDRIYDQEILRILLRMAGEVAEV